jgi:enolase
VKKPFRIGVNCDADK